MSFNCSSLCLFLSFYAHPYILNKTVIIIIIITIIIITYNNSSNKHINKNK